MDDSEVMFLRALLLSRNIRFFIVGDNFGGLYPGVQVASYNERRFLVSIENLQEAQELVCEHRKLYEPSFVNLTNKSKLRVLVEFIVGGWCFPSGPKDKEEYNNKLK